MVPTLGAGCTVGISSFLHGRVRKAHPTDSQSLLELEQVQRAKGLLAFQHVSASINERGIRDGKRYKRVKKDESIG